ncbi:MAG: transcriptional regulator, PadR-like protein family protein [Candidatus Saccharibacteria bacterium GW2011_GWC2_48_9]|nr:MAG: transcriptional regulator, PadR-like protein family protein [Candidatus Saccharibacteria bacterium GW2011_GWC2_48_9]
MNNTTEMLKGVLEGSILEVISRNTTYGYDITQQLRTLGFEDIVEGTVYTILVRLEKNKLVRTEKRPSAIGPPRKFYSLTDLGYKELHTFWARWDFVSSKINELRRG